MSTEVKKVQCIICGGSEEDGTTGPLSTKVSSTKGSATAHQNCLLYSSGIFCACSPENDDLFGFSVEDVLMEYKRGRLLNCHKCKKKGATVGCEVKSCRKSYHYPCAIQVEALIVEAEYIVYCPKHKPDSSGERAAASGKSSTASSINGNSGADNNNNGKTFSKLYCLLCENKEDHSIELVEDDVLKLCCKEHQKQLIHKEMNEAVQLSNTLGYRHLKSTPKRRSGYSNKQGVKLRKRRRGDSSNADNGKVIDMDFAPLDSDLEDSENRNTVAVSSTPISEEPEPENRDVDTTFDSDAESLSLLHPVPVVVGSEHSKATEHSPDLTSAACQCRVSSPPGSTLTSGSALDPFPSSGSLNKTSTSTRTSPALGSPVVAPKKHLTPVSRSPPPSSPHSAPVSPAGPDSAASKKFWSCCNEAGCTEYIFNTFVSDIVSRSKRIIADQASAEDYDLTLKVIKASGKLSQMLSQQEHEFKMKQSQLQRATEAIGVARSALDEQAALSE
ncbi:hypothetical protein UPYG_G00306910 [Umbra pygmaea]|uniref:PHD-type domain-containing protein n=1 Tax=Umbra pygmaea TaxID=75934 RepID=A0ABD0WDL7_UMBPY